MISITPLLIAMKDKNASDLHLRVGNQPAMRLDGRLFRVQTDTITVDDMRQVMAEVMTPFQSETFEKEHELDFAVGIKGAGRFRINAFKQRGTTSMAIRAIKTTIPDFRELNLPNIVLDLSMKKRGLILVTGTTGSGKTTLLSSMVDYMNQNAALNIVTIEDPIEFLFKDKSSIIAQREVGTDSINFSQALRASFRQDPDVILIGEIRDKETMETALSAADTGHLVLSTLHTMNAVETISRILSFFSPHQHDQIRMVLANVLVAVISLRLLPRQEGAGRVPAAEILINNGTIAEYIKTPEKMHLINDAIAEGITHYGSQTFDQSLFSLYQDGHITLATAKQNANNPDDFELMVKGVTGTSDRRWTT